MCLLGCETCGECFLVRRGCHGRLLGCFACLCSKKDGTIWKAARPVQSSSGKYIDKVNSIMIAAPLTRVVVLPRSLLSWVVGRVCDVPTCVCVCQIMEDIERKEKLARSMQNRSSTAGSTLKPTTTVAPTEIAYGLGTCLPLCFAPFPPFLLLPATHQSLWVCAFASLLASCASAPAPPAVARGALQPLSPTRTGAAMPSTAPKPRIMYASSEPFVVRDARVSLCNRMHTLTHQVSFSLSPSDLERFTRDHPSPPLLHLLLHLLLLHL